LLNLEEKRLRMRDRLFVEKKGKKNYCGKNKLKLCRWSTILF